MIEVILGLLGVGVIGGGAATLFGVGVFGKLREHPHKLPITGARLNRTVFSPWVVDTLLEELIERFDEHFGFIPGTSAHAFQGVRFSFFEGPDNGSVRALPHRPDAAGQASWERADHLEIAYMRGDKIGRTATAYEAFRRLLAYNDMDEWDNDNGRNSDERWLPEWFDLIEAVDAPRRS